MNRLVSACSDFLLTKAHLQYATLTSQALRVPWGEKLQSNTGSRTTKRAGNLRKKL